MPAGRTPKPDGKASTRHKPTIESVELGSSSTSGKRGSIADPPKSSPPIPTFVRKEWRELHVLTREWWLGWLEAEQSSQFIGTDWRRLRMIGLPLVEGFNRAVEAKDVKLANELAGRIMQLERDFGATPDARLRLRWTVRRPGDTPRGDENDGEEGAAKPKRTRKVEGDPRLALVQGGKKAG